MRSGNQEVAGDICKSHSYGEEGDRVQAAAGRGVVETCLESSSLSSRNGGRSRQEVE